MIRFFIKFYNFFLSIIQNYETLFQLKIDQIFPEWELNEMSMQEGLKMRRYITVLQNITCKWVHLRMLTKNFLLFWVVALFFYIMIETIFSPKIRFLVIYRVSRYNYEKQPSFIFEILLFPLAVYNLIERFFEYNNKWSFLKLEIKWI